MAMIFLAVACVLVMGASAIPAADRPQVQCLKYCEYGFVTENGRSICQCREVSPRENPDQPICFKFCPNGFLTENGQLICECVEAVQLPSAEKRQVCSNKRCRNYCVNGRVRDADGCETCQCKTESDACPPRPCQTIACPPGEGFATDDQGCATCDCTPCSRVSCFMECPNGFVYKNGCPVCQCA